MVGKRSRPIHRTHSKSHLMSWENGDSHAPSKPNGFFNNPRLFIGFNSKIAGFPDGEGGSRSPTSTLDAKIFSDYKPCRSPRGFDNPDSQGVGLGILAALHNDTGVATYGKTTLLSPKNSETRFPAKTFGSSVTKKRSQPISIEPTGRRDDQSGMEYSESYTCITSHGPKPSIRQIFNDPVEAEKRSLKCCKPAVLEAEKRNLKCCKPAVFEAAASSSSYADAPTFPAADFLSVCYLCRRQLRHGKDIYMYRGDKAFCSEECRYQQIVSDEKERCAPTSMKRASASPQAALCWYPGAKIFSTRTMAAA